MSSEGLRFGLDAATQAAQVAESRREALQRRSQRHIRLKEQGHHQSLYTTRAEKRIGLTKAEFRDLSTEFRRIVGAGVAPGTATPATPGKRRWQVNGVLPTSDDLLLFCLYYYHRPGAFTQQALLERFSVDRSHANRFDLKMDQPYASRLLRRALPWLNEALDSCYRAEAGKREDLAQKLEKFDRRVTRLSPA